MAWQKGRKRDPQSIAKMVETKAQKKAQRDAASAGGPGIDRTAHSAHGASSGSIQP